MNKNEYQSEIDTMITLKGLEVENEMVCLGFHHGSVCPNAKDHDCSLSQDNGCSVCDERIK